MCHTRVKNRESILQDTLTKLTSRLQSLYEPCSGDSITPSVPTAFVPQRHHGTRHASSSTFSCLVTTWRWFISHLRCSLLPFLICPCCFLGFGVLPLFLIIPYFDLFLLRASSITLWPKEIFVQVGNVCWTHSPSRSGERHGLAMYSGLTLNSWSSWLSLSSAGITGVYHSARALKATALMKVLSFSA